MTQFLNSSPDASASSAARYSVPAATAELAAFSTGVAFADIPADVISIAKEQAIATIGSCLAGNHMGAIDSMAAGMSILGQGETATLFGRKELVPAPTAAMFNAATAQVIEWDDWVIISHSGGAVIPTAFAAGEHAGASGQDVLTAIVIGNEVNARTSRAMQRGAYVGNSMPNHQIETALMAARLLKLDEWQARCAVGLSAFLAMENCPIGWTNDSKILINALPAMWGIVSAGLAQAGLRANQTIVEHPAGFMSTVSEEVDYDELVKGLGTEWQSRTMNTKRHPTCAYNLAAIECAIAIHDRIPNFDASKVAKIVVHCPGVTSYVAKRYQAVEPSLYEMVRSG
ncbi:MAG TPA: MmgE/PrpD family protein, partial [Devosia sp.]|nr:MmgE/PrpD family protein [Devosia sp.]